MHVSDSYELYLYSIVSVSMNLIFTVLCVSDSYELYLYSIVSDSYELNLYSIACLWFLWTLSLMQYCVSLTPMNFIITVLRVSDSYELYHYSIVCLWFL